MNRFLVLCFCLAVFCTSCGKFKPFTAAEKKDPNTIDVTFAIERGSRSNNMSMLSTYQLNGLIFRLYKQSGDFAFVEELFGPWNVLGVTDTDVTFAIADMPKIVAGYDLAMFEDNYTGDTTSFTMQRVYYSGTSMGTASPLDFTTALPGQVYTINAGEMPDCATPIGLGCTADITFQFCKRDAGVCTDATSDCGIASKVASSASNCAVQFPTGYSAVTSGSVYTSSANYGRYPTKNLTGSPVVTSKLFVPYSSGCSDPDGPPVNICLTHHNAGTYILAFEPVLGNTAQLCQAATTASQTIYVNTSVTQTTAMRPISQTQFGLLGTDCAAIANFNRNLTITKTNSF